MMEIAVDEIAYAPYIGNDMYIKNKFTNDISNNANGSYIALYVTIGICLLLGIILGIIFAKRAVNK